MTERKEFRELTDPDKATQVIAELPLSVGTEKVSLTEAPGRITAERVDATIDVPGFDRATLDGYAVRARDTFSADEANPVHLSIAGSVHAGEKPTVAPDSGEAVEISTGAVMPDKADAMIPIERVEEHDNEVAVFTSVAPGENVMFAGADIAAGERAVGPNQQLSAREIGVLSAIGKSRVTVKCQPTVGLISTGDELTRPEDPLDHSRGEIHDVNTYSLAAAIRDAGGSPQIYPHANDDVEQLRSSLINAAEECDFVLTSGSTSASTVDVIYDVLEQEGQQHLHGVAVKPGKPLLAGVINGTPYVGLPGYPVSALMTFKTFVSPVLREASGLDNESTTVTGTMCVEERFQEGRRRLLPVGIVEDENNDLLVYPVDKGSGATTSLTEADGIVSVPADTAYVSEDETVRVSLFSSDLHPPTVFGIGEDDPILMDALDQLRSSRYLSAGSRVGNRQLRRGIPDFAILTGPLTNDPSGEIQMSWTHEWGLIASPNAQGRIDSLYSLTKEDTTFVNRTSDSGLRSALDTAVSDLAADRDMTTRDITTRIDGWNHTVQGHESPARIVQRGDADAGIGIKQTAESLNLPFISLGELPVRFVSNPTRTEKPGVQQLLSVLSNSIF